MRGQLRTITAPQLWSLLTTGSEVKLVEALGPSYFDDVHLPGAVNIPPDRVDALAPRLIPDPRDIVVVYCSATCTNSMSTAWRLVELGYQDVRVYQGGKEHWIECGHPVERPQSCE